MKLFDVRVLTVIVATSYITLGIAAPEKAENLWFVYGAVMFVLALVNLMLTKADAR